jgi:hypothetical protein
MALGLVVGTAAHDRPIRLSVQLAPNDLQIKLMRLPSEPEAPLFASDLSVNRLKAIKPARAAPQRKAGHGTVTDAPALNSRRRAMRPLSASFRFRHEAVYLTPP